MNTLMIDPERVLVDAEEEPTQKMFESLGIKCVKVHAGSSQVYSTMLYVYYYMPISSSKSVLRKVLNSVY